MKNAQILAATLALAATLPGTNVATGRPLPAAQVEEAGNSRYIVALREDVVAVEEDRLRRRGTTQARARAVERLSASLEARYGARVQALLSRVFPGAVLELDEAAAAALAADRRVAMLERDKLVELAPVRVPAPYTDVPRELRRARNWGLDRLDQRRGLNRKFESDYDGTGVIIYVVDTGVLKRHRDFKGRLGRGQDFTVSGNRSGLVDCNGHGTHVASIAAGRTWGVAPGAEIVPLKVFQKCGGRGVTTYVLEALEWILNRHDPSRRGVINMSLGVEGGSSSLDAAVRAIVAAGFVSVAAAGNDEADACGQSPARVSVGITVGASDYWDRDDLVADFSNHGPCVDIFAPGTVIEAAGITSRTSSTYKSGTSMAAPFVAGAAALALDKRPSATSATIHRALVRNATKRVLSDVPSKTVNLLLYAVPEKYRGLRHE